MDESQSQETFFYKFGSARLRGTNPWVAEKGKGDLNPQSAIVA